jgi:hypothetical protein
MPITLNPQLVTNRPGGFHVTSEGYVQGEAMDDPAIRNSLVAAIVDPAYTAAPMYGGMAITESMITPGTESSAIMHVIRPATAAANVTGFSVFNQSAGMIQTPQSPVPLASSGMGLNLFRLGSRARIAVQLDSAVAAALQAGNINQALYWDYTNQKLLNAPGGTAIPVKVIDINFANSKVVDASLIGSGIVNWKNGAACAIIEI